MHIAQYCELDTLTWRFIILLAIPIKCYLQILMKEGNAQRKRRGQEHITQAKPQSYGIKIRAQYEDRHSMKSLTICVCNTTYLQNL